jgi:ABC-type oligopeptide transport system substrate-binding subunit
MYHRNVRAYLLLYLILTIIPSAALLSSCGTPPEAMPTTIPTAAPSFTPSPIPPTETPLPTPTITLTPTATPLPGAVVIPVDTMTEEIPWLPLDGAKRPVANMLVFNLNRPPFNSALVRQAFAHAVDRQVIVEMVERYGASNPKPATNLTPPQTLGRDLYNEVGASFNPDLARSLLAEAGYSDPSTFPQATFLVNASGDIAPGARFNMANAMVEMWKTHLGITSVQVEAIRFFGNYGERLRANPPEIFWLGWAADYNDPDNFLNVIFHTDAEFNYGNFSNADFDHLVERAAIFQDPSSRQELYISAERILTETEAAILPLYHSTAYLP